MFMGMERNAQKNRKYARKFIHYVIADGENTRLWYDLWRGQILLIENEMVVQLIQVPLDCKSELSNRSM